MLMSYRTFTIHDSIRRGTKELATEISKLKEHSEADKTTIDKFDQEIVGLADALSKALSMQHVAEAAELTRKIDNLNAGKREVSLAKNRERESLRFKLSSLTLPFRNGFWAGQRPGH